MTINRVKTWQITQSKYKKNYKKAVVNFDSLSKYLRSCIIIVWYNNYVFVLGDCEFDVEERSGDGGK